MALPAMDTNAASATADRGAQVVLDVWPWGLLTVAAAFLCTMAIQRMAGGIALRPLRRTVPGHWTERARLAHPGWVTLSWGQIVQPVIWFIIVDALTDWQARALASVVALAAFSSAGWVSTRMESRVRGRAVSMLDWLRSWTVILLFFLTPFIVFPVLLWRLPGEFNWSVLWMVLGAAAVLLVLSLGGTLAIGRWIGLLRPPTDRLRAIVEVVARRFGVEQPVTCILRWKVANALAFPFGRVIAMTDVALESCTDDELAAICAHEMAHLNEPPRIRVARLAAQFAWLPLFLVGPLSGALGSRGYWVGLGLSLVAHLLVRRMVFAMEVRADAVGKANEGEAGTYARALEKLYEINLTPAVTRQRRPTHPHLYDRLLAAGLTPDYPRPEPPSRWRGKVAVGFTLVVTLCCVFLWLGFMGSVQHPAGGSRGTAQRTSIRAQHDPAPIPAPEK